MSSFNKLELLTAKQEFNDCADEVDSLYTKLLQTKHMLYRLEQQQQPLDNDTYSKLRHRLNRLTKQLTSKQHVMDSMLSRLQSIESDYVLRNKDKPKHVAFVNTVFNHNTSLEYIYRHQQEQPTKTDDIDIWDILFGGESEF